MARRCRSRTGTFVRAATYLDHLDPAYLRYYYASKLTPKLDDLDLNLDEFVAKVNSDLVGKVVNLASRTARFVEATGLSAEYPDDGGLFAAAAREAKRSPRPMMPAITTAPCGRSWLLADRANQYVDGREPWKLRKDPARAAELQDVCTVSLNLFRQFVVYLAPVLPQPGRANRQLFGQPIDSWDEATTPLVGTPVSPFETFDEAGRTRRRSKP